MRIAGQYVLREAVAAADLTAYHFIRRSVLFEARGRAGYDENYPDEMNAANIRLLLLCEERAVCAFRLDRTATGTGIIRLMAVIQGEQKKGHGRAALARLGDFARTLRLRAIEVNSARDAVEFYRRCGFVVIDAMRKSPLLRLDLG